MELNFYDNSLKEGGDPEQQITNINDVSLINKENGNETEKKFKEIEV